MARKKAKTKLTFAVTIPMPEGSNVKDTRATLKAFIEGALERDGYVEPEVKVYLLNKETTYA